MELDLGLRLGQNGARSRPPPSPLMIGEIPLPLSFLINDGGSGFGYFVGMGLLTDRWVW